MRTIYFVVWDGASAAGGQQNFGGGAPTLRRFLQFILKYNVFLGIFWSKFLLINTILFYCKVCWCTPKTCAQGVCPYLPPSLLRHCMFLSKWKYAVIFWQVFAECLVVLPMPGRSQMLTIVKAAGIRCIEIICIVNKAGASDAAAILHLFSKKYDF